MNDKEGVFHTTIKSEDTVIHKREIYGQLDNYKFTFDIITRDIKTKKE
jgi:hypothetical protein